MLELNSAEHWPARNRIIGHHCPNEKHPIQLISLLVKLQDLKWLCQMRETSKMCIVWGSPGHRLGTTDVDHHLGKECCYPVLSRTCILIVQCSILVQLHETCSVNSWWIPISQDQAWDGCESHLVQGFTRLERLSYLYRTAWSTSASDTEALEASSECRTPDPAATGSPAPHIPR